MKVVLYMAATANGLIAATNDNTDWISQAEWDAYSLFVRESGCLVVGRRTYELLTRQAGFAELSDVELVVVSRSSPELVSPRHRIARSPEEALGMLAGYERVAVAGGSILNASFIQANLVDELWLDIEPVLLGRGMPLFAASDFSCDLRLLEVRHITPQELQLRYEVVKS